MDLPSIIQGLEGLTAVLGHPVDALVAQEEDQPRVNRGIFNVEDLSDLSVGCPPMDIHVLVL